MADAQQLGLLSLPYEIREMTYELLIISDQWIIAEMRFVRSIQWDELYCCKLSKVRVCSPEIGSCAQFLRACKLFLAKTSQFLYGHNSFELSLKTLGQPPFPLLAQTTPLTSLHGTRRDRSRQIQSNPHHPNCAEITPQSPLSILRRP